MPETPQKTRVAVVAFDGISPFHLSVPCMVFGDAMGADSPFEVVVCTADPLPLKTTGGFSPVSYTHLTLPTIYSV